MMRTLDDALEEGRFQAVQSFIEDVPCHTLDVRMLLGILSAVFPGRYQLPGKEAYKRFYQRVEWAIKRQRGDEEGEKLLEGLKGLKP